MVMVDELHHHRGRWFTVYTDCFVRTVSVLKTNVSFIPSLFQLFNFLEEKMGGGGKFFPRGNSSFVLYCQECTDCCSG